MPTHTARLHRALRHRPMGRAGWNEYRVMHSLAESPWPNPHMR